LKALLAISGPDGMKILVLPNLRIYDDVLKEALGDESKRAEAERVLAVILLSLDGLERSRGASATRVNGVGNLEGLRERLVEKVGEVVAEKLIASGRSHVAQILLETDIRL
jgi:transcription initiation factor TFIID subunit 6